MTTPERKTRNVGKVPKWTPRDWERMTHPTDGSRPMTDRDIAVMISKSLPHGQEVTHQAVSAARRRAGVPPAAGRGKGYLVLKSTFWFPLKPWDYRHDLYAPYALLMRQAHLDRLDKRLPRSDQRELDARLEQLRTLPDERTGKPRRWVICYMPEAEAHMRLFLHPWRESDGEDTYVCARHNPANFRGLI